MSWFQRLRQWFEFEPTRAEPLVRMYPPEPQGSCPVIFFTKTFDDRTRNYPYAAIKAEGKWFTTGRICKGWTWDELMYWLDRSGPFPQIRVLTQSAAEKEPA